MNEIHANDEQLQRILLGQQDFLGSVSAILDEEQTRDDILRAVVLCSDRPRLNAIRDLDPNRLFHIGTIRRLCVKYRLRFLDGKWFKGPLPLQAIHGIRQLEDRAAAPLSGFKILAPARCFKLGDCDADPLLFVQVTEDRYYLVHKWGADLAWHRSILTWPLRTPVHFGATVLVIACILAALMPTELIATDPAAGWMGAHRVLFLFWTAMVCASFSVFGWFAFFGRFSTEAWSSRHFN